MRQLGLEGVEAGVSAASMPRRGGGRRVRREMDLPVARFEGVRSVDYEFCFKGQVQLGFGHRKEVVSRIIVASNMQPFARFIRVDPGNAFLTQLETCFPFSSKRVSGLVSASVMPGPSLPARAAKVQYIQLMLARVSTFFFLYFPLHLRTLLVCLPNGRGS